MRVGLNDRSGAIVLLQCDLLASTSAIFLLFLSLSFLFSKAGNHLKWKWKWKWFSVVLALIFGQLEMLLSLTEFEVTIKHPIFQKIISGISLKSIQTQPKLWHHLWCGGCILSEAFPELYSFSCNKDSYLVDVMSFPNQHYFGIFDSIESPKIGRWNNLIFFGILYTQRPLLVRGKTNFVGSRQRIRALRLVSFIYPSSQPLTTSFHGNLCGAQTSLLKLLSFLGLPP